jgi:hypothetical protein
MTTIRDIPSNDRLDELLWQILNEWNPKDRLYVYRIENGKAMRPAIYNGGTFPDLLEYLRDEHGGGRFRIMIRRGEPMMLAGAVSVERSLR